MDGLCETVPWMTTSEGTGNLSKKSELLASLSKFYVSFDSKCTGLVFI